MKIGNATKMSEKIKPPPEASVKQSDPRIARTRQHAMQAALELFAESGIQACTLENVAERSGISRSTLYRHWEEKSQLLKDALRSQIIERVAPDTGNLRDDMLTAMLELGHALEHTTWGAMVAQLMAAAAVDPDVAEIQKAAADYHTAIDIGIITRAIERGELAENLDPEHAALMFSAPIFYQHLFHRKTADAKWITGHIDKTVALLGSG